MKSITSVKTRLSSVMNTAAIPSPAYSAEDTIGYLRELAYQAKDYILSDIPLQQTSLMV